ncbi:ABC transporter permease/substrate binding protein [Holzapfeliella sp. He02]|uniref:ABC transporter permease/substrate binding protein n=1 Tax=Holzapfeliella saturejae TaxID=3082953 RepID=A0ABU8SEX6_9LACO
MTANIDVPRLPIAEWIDVFVQWFTQTFAQLFNVIQTIGQGGIDWISDFLIWINPFVLMLLIVVTAYYISGKKLGLTIFSFLGLLFIYNQHLWNDLMSTLTLVMVSSLIALIIGVPLGILDAKSQTASKIITPFLDFMQTMPGFVYLIPAVAFFGIGVMPGVVSSVIFALPPVVRMTNLGIHQVPKSLVETSASFGSTDTQRLFKLDLPYARNTILEGANQTIMMSLSMVVIASMIGAPGLGRGVLSAVQRAQVGHGFVNGLALVIMAIIIDRFAHNINRHIAHRKLADTKTRNHQHKVHIIAAVALMLLTVTGGVVQAATTSGAHSKGHIKLVYVEWDDAVATTNVAGELLRQAGYDVDIMPLDDAIMWKSVATKQADAMLCGWLPTTHKHEYAEYKDKLDLLGANYDKAQVGLVVPDYMSANSIEDLKDEANKTITGIEPSESIVDYAQNATKEYANLKGWQVSTSSSGAMAVVLGQAIKNHQDVVVTGWSPHWMFAKYHLKILQDPKKVMGESEKINTIARQGLKDDYPEAYNLLKNFKWDEQDISEVMLRIRNGENPQEVAKWWLSNHASRVQTFKQ